MNEFPFSLEFTRGDTSGELKITRKSDGQAAFVLKVDYPIFKEMELAEKFKEFNRELERAMDALDPFTYNR